jgi:hypothetical protein
MPAGSTAYLGLGLVVVFSYLVQKLFRFFSCQLNQFVLVILAVQRRPVKLCFLLDVLLHREDRQHHADEDRPDERGDKEQQHRLREGYRRL